jgi:hypothetical protein
MAHLAFRKNKFNTPVTVPAANVATLVSLLPASKQALSGVHRITIHNIGENNIEVAGKTVVDGAPTSGSMDVLEPGDSISFEWEPRDLKTIYVKADTADTKAFVWAEGK